MKPMPDAAGDSLDLLAKAAGLPAVVTAVCHPCDQLSLAAAVAAHHAGLIEPLLVGPERKIRQV
ncbi:MAG: enoyl-CoA hydratase, partial [Pirellulales bacterium]